MAVAVHALYVGRQTGKSPVSFLLSPTLQMNGCIAVELPDRLCDGSPTPWVTTVVQIGVGHLPVFQDVVKVHPIPEWHRPPPATVDAGKLPFHIIQFLPQSW